jgi:plasmid stabilization system protein ParE
VKWIVLVRAEAERDLEVARDWYEQKRSGGEFLDEFAAAMRAVELITEREHLYHGQFRRVLFRRFPYKIFYQIIGERLVVFRVLHAKRDHERQFR